MTATESYLPNIEAYTPKTTRKQIFLTQLVAAGIAVPLLLGYPKESPVIPKESKIIVHKGDTVYGIVAEYYPESVDVSQAEYQIMQDNGIKVAGDLQVGQVLYLPEVK